MPKKFFVLSFLTAAFLFRFAGTNGPWVTCQNEWKNACGFAAWDCSTGVRYECLTNIERPAFPQPKPLTAEEREKILERSEDKMP
jgi:hypothetical protein